MTSILQTPKESHIFMCAVDTGWINDEKPVERAKAAAQMHNFQTPLDEVDAAARVLDPVIAPLIRHQRGEPHEAPHGVFLKGNGPYARIFLSAASTLTHIQPHAPEDYERCEW